MIDAWEREWIYCQAVQKCLSGFTGHAQKDSVLQYPLEIAIQTGHDTSLHCNFSTSSSVFYINWYQQHLTQPPQLLLWMNAFRPRMSSGRFSSVLSMENSHVLLHVQDVKFQHRAVYFCALSTHWCLQHAAMYRKVWVLWEASHHHSHIALSPAHPGRVHGACGEAESLPNQPA